MITNRMGKRGVSPNEKETEKVYDMERKVTHHQVETYFESACVGVQGSRDHHEDEFDFQIANGVGMPMYMFGIYDGHSGNDVSQYLRNQFLTQLKTNIEEKETQDLVLPVVRIIEKTCEQINDSIKECEMEGGSCALVVLVVDGLLYTVNIGDCRALLCCPEMGSVVLSRDHNIHSNKSEEHRIKVSGGVIEKNRIGGHLSPSRAFGDFKYTDMGLSCEPEIKIRPFLSRPHFILMGTDGIWDAVDNTYAIMFVKFHMMMYPEMALPDILFRLLEKVRVKLKENDRTMDNATIACIVFKQGKTMHEIVELMKTDEIKNKWASVRNRKSVGRFRYDPYDTTYDTTEEEIEDDDSDEIL